MEISFKRFCAHLLIGILWCVLLGLHLRRVTRAKFESLQQLWGPSYKEIKGSGKTSVSPGATKANLFWFIQISDLHISRFDSGGGKAHFESFLKNTLKLVRPRFVVATGDLTDAKVKSGVASEQFIEEWEGYRKQLTKHMIFSKKDFWFDIRGNHDNFNVASWDSSSNLYPNFSVQKTSTYWHEFDFGFGKYGLVAIDGCTDHGNSRPLNFFGSLDQKKMDSLEDALENLQNANHTFVISHYPIVTMQFQRSSKGTSFSELSHKFSAYLSGHLHRLTLGLGRYLYAKQPTGFLELELDDLKDHKMFRIVAVDHDVISFQDCDIDEPPFVLITNPPDARFLLPAHEDVQLARRSSHVRVLIFASPSVISKAAVHIDSQAAIPLSQPEEALGRMDEEVLYVAPWEPQNYAKGLHSIEVSIVLNNGTRKAFKQTFSLDGSQTRVNSFGESLLLFPLMDVFKLSLWAGISSVFCLYLCMAIFLRRKGPLESVHLWIYQSCQVLRRDHPFSLHRLLYSFWARLGIFFWNSQSCHLMIVFLLYCLVGPLAAAYLATGDRHFLLVFAWGIWGRECGWIDIFDTWMFTAFMSFTQWIPAFFIIMVSETEFTLYYETIELPDHTPLLPVGARPIIPRYLFCGIKVVWWLLCLKQLIFFTRAYGVWWLIFSFSHSWHLIWCTVMMFRNQRFFLGEPAQSEHIAKVE